MKYPDYFPTDPLFNPDSSVYESFRYAWEQPLQANSNSLSKMLISAAKTLESEVGFSQMSYAVREAAKRLDETLRIIGGDLPCYKQVDAMAQVHRPYPVNQPNQ